MERLNKKFASIRNAVPKPEIRRKPGAEIGLIAFGSADPAIVEAQDHLAQKGVYCDYLRLKALPASDDVLDFIQVHDRNYVVEMNRDGQAHQILSLDTPEHAAKLVSLSNNDGLPLTAAWIEGAVMAQENK
jgi:2-oxoglutarate ferredoxin oxidoreductase subunit alpha